MNECMSEWVSEWLYEWVSKWVSEWVSKWVSERMRDGRQWCCNFLMEVAKLRLWFSNEGVIFCNDTFKFCIWIVSVFSLWMQSELCESHFCISAIHLLMVSMWVDISVMFTYICISEYICRSIYAIIRKEVRGQYWIVKEIARTLGGLRDLFV